MRFVSANYIFLTKLPFYLIQFKAPFFHSCNKPAVRTTTTITAVEAHIVNLVIFSKIPIGNTSATSISKIRKIRVVIKNRSEKGARAFLKGENPHSKGVIFSRSLIDFSLVNIVVVTKIKEISPETVVKVASITINNLISK